MLQNKKEPISFLQWQYRQQHLWVQTWLFQWFRIGTICYRCIWSFDHSICPRWSLQHKYRWSFWYRMDDITNNLGLYLFHLFFIFLLIYHPFEWHLLLDNVLPPQWLQPLIDVFLDWVILERRELNCQRNHPNLNLRIFLVERYILLLDTTSMVIATMLPSLE